MSIDRVTTRVVGVSEPERTKRHFYYRYPFVERAVRDFSALCGGPDSQVRVSIKGTLTKLLEDGGASFTSPLTLYDNNSCSCTEESQVTGKTNGTSIPGVDVEEDMQQSDEDEAGRKG